MRAIPSLIMKNSIESTVNKKPYLCSLTFSKRYPSFEASMKFLPLIAIWRYANLFIRDVTFDISFDHAWRNLSTARKHAFLLWNFHEWMKNIISMKNYKNWTKRRIRLPKAKLPYKYLMIIMSVLHIGLSISYTGPEWKYHLATTLLTAKTMVVMKISCVQKALNKK